MNITLLQAVSEANATLLYKNDPSKIILTGAASDNRLVKDGDIFVCIKGSHIDGHSFARNAMEKGAKAILAEYNPFVEEFGDNPPIPVLLVKNSIKALGEFAHARREAFAIGKDGKIEAHKVIGITGTAGKTSLKELIAHILSINPETMEFDPSRVAKNPYNNNTQIGMPLAILNASGDEKFWVLEVGISHSHDMDELGAILEPDIAVVLNAGSAHNEGLGEKGVVYHKARFIKYAKDTGVAFVSQDYPLLVEETKKYRDDIIYFSVDTDENLNPKKSLNKEETQFFCNMPRAFFTGVNNDGFGKYHIQIFDEDLHVISPFLSSSGAENCLAASCVALSVNIPSKVVSYGISSMPLPNMRFNRIEIKNWLIIDDTYNANPLSSLRMLESAKELAENKNFFLLMGEMGELGDISYFEHVEMGRHIAKSGISYVFWVGKQKNAIAEGLSQSNFTGKFIPVTSPEDFMENFTRYISQDQKIHIQTNNNLILFKGSRSNYLENYVKLFMDYCNAL